MNTVLWDIVVDAFIDTLKIIPFLFITYLVLEWVENKASDSTVSLIKKSGKLGPVYGGLLGLVPMCGFSSAASNFYAGSVITEGTLLAVFLATSDEMLPILISRKIGISIIAKILIVKAIISILIGLVIDFINRKKKSPDFAISDLCEKAHCECEKGIFHSALIHCLKIAGFILGMNLVLGLIMNFVGGDLLSKIIGGYGSVWSVIFMAIFGLIPNCGVSVLVSELYCSQTISFGAFLAGLLANSGVGLAVLIHLSKNKKDVAKIISILLITSIIFGLIIH